MVSVSAIVLHRPAGPDAGPLECQLADARRDLGERLVRRLAAAGAARAELRVGEPDDTPFGRRVRGLVADLAPGGLVLAGSGSAALARPRDLRPFVEAAASSERRGLVNNRYSADLVALGDPSILHDVPDLPSDNSLPRWLDEVARIRVDDLRTRWRLAFDVDSPLDLALAGLAASAEAAVVGDRLRRVAAAFADRRAEVLVAGRTSAATLRLLERRAAARTRALVEERGLRAGSPLAIGSDATAPAARPRRPPSSVLAMLLEARGPAALGSLVAELADAAVIDSRVLLAARLGADERRWPPPEDRFASDLLLAERVADPWLRQLTAAARGAPVPIVLGGHTLVGPSLRLLLRRRSAAR
jgi:hypothetical protein